MSQIIIRKLTTIAEMEEASDIEQTVWKMTPIPVHQKFTVAQHGGIILGAYEQEEMIGFLYSFPGMDGGKTYLCSHLLGVLPTYRGQGIGIKLKQAQRTHAHHQGYAFITWTYDPLESRNAYVNLHKLQARGVAYKPNYYGPLRDKLNRGLPSDRIQIIWDIEEDITNATYPLKKENILVQKDENNPIINNREIIVQDEPYYIAIPTNFQRIKEADHALAKKWRKVTREAMQQLFLLGYHATDIVTVDQGENVYYLFTTNQKEQPVK